MDKLLADRIRDNPTVIPTMTDPQDQVPDLWRLDSRELLRGRQLSDIEHCRLDLLVTECLEEHVADQPRAVRLFRRVGVSVLTTSSPTHPSFRQNG